MAQGVEGMRDDQYAWTVTVPGWEPLEGRADTLADAMAEARRLARLLSHRGAGWQVDVPGGLVLLGRGEE